MKNGILKGGKTSLISREKKMMRKVHMEHAFWFREQDLICYHNDP